jgi:xylulose-5-phosphate/fructose-6-phosphate phosphoketolase
MSISSIELAKASNPLSAEEIRLLDAYWRAANYLTVGQLYLRENPLLRTPLRREHVKPLVLGHWGTTPGLNFIYVHLNRLIREHDLNMICMAGTGHGGQAILANAYLEGTYTEVFPNFTRDEAGLRRFFKQFAFPNGVPSHVGPDTPGGNSGGRRIRVRTGPRFRRGVRQPESHRGRGNRRWRGGNGTLGGELALK